MNTTDWIVLASGITAIAGVNWWFFAPHGAAAVGGSADGDVATLGITVKGGYSPDTIRLKAHDPVKLIFDRQERSSCSEEVVFPDLQLRRFLPAFEKTTVEVPGLEKGTYEFTCGMSMLRGRLVVE